MKKKNLLFASLMVLSLTIISGLPSCKDYNEDMFADLENKMAENDKNLRQTLQEQIVALQQSRDSLNNESIKLQDSLDYYCTVAKEKADSAFLKQYIDTKADSTLVYSKMDAIDQALKELAKRDSLALVDSINAVNQAIFELQADVTENTNRIIGLSDSVKTALTEAAKAYNLAKQDSARIAAILGWQETQSDSIKSLYNDSIPALRNDINNALAAAQKAWNDAKAYTDSTTQKIKQDFNDSITANVARLTAAYAAADLLLQTQLNALKDSIDALSPRVRANEIAIQSLIGRVTALENKINDIDDRLDDVEDALSKLITGIIIQGTTNPVFGEFALPFNMRSNLLMAYYGNTANGLKFPVAWNGDAGRDIKYYAFDGIVDDSNNARRLTNKDLEMLQVSSGEKTSGKGILLSDAKDNAGTLYLTVNPSNIDFSGEQLSLVNSQEAASGIQLDTLVKSDHLLTFGMTRAADNGFYEAKARLDSAEVDNVKIKINLDDVKELKNALSDLVQLKDVSKIANTIQDVITKTRIDAFAAKATWTDSIDTHNIYSQYGVAATAIQPLSYATPLPHISSIPGMQRVENLIAKLIDGIQASIPSLGISIPGMTISHIALKSFSELSTTFTITLNFSVDANFDPAPFLVEVKDGSNVVIGSATVDMPNQSITVPVDRTISIESLMNSMYDEITAPLADINTMIDDINSYLTSVNDVLDDVNGIISGLHTSIDNVETQLFAYLDQLNARLCKIVNMAEKAIHPVLLVQTDNGLARLSGISQYSPSLINANSMSLIPTSYSAELLAPAVYKLVGVTNVFDASNLSLNAQGGDSNCINALNTANNGENLAKVIPGTTRVIDFNIQSGYVYEVAYSAVDYSGKIVVKKYYIKAV